MYKDIGQILIFCMIVDIIASDFDVQYILNFFIVIGNPLHCDFLNGFCNWTQPKQQQSIEWIWKSKFRKLQNMNSLKHGICSLKYILSFIISLFLSIWYLLYTGAFHKSTILCLLLKNCNMVFHRSIRVCSTASWIYW